MQLGNYSALHLWQIPEVFLHKFLLVVLWTLRMCLEWQQGCTGISHWQNNTFWRINISLSFGQTPQEHNSDQIWALIHRVKSSRICTPGPSSCKAQQPELCGAQCGDVGAETSPWPMATPKPVGDAVLQGTDPSLWDPAAWQWDHGWWAAAFTRISLAVFFPLQCLSQPPSAKAQQKGWLFAPEYLLSLFVQEMGNSSPHKPPVSSMAAHTPPVPGKGATSRGLFLRLSSSSAAPGAKIHKDANSSGWRCSTLPCFAGLQGASRGTFLESCL